MQMHFEVWVVSALNDLLLITTPEYTAVLIDYCSSRRYTMEKSRKKWDLICPIREIM